MDQFFDITDEDIKRATARQTVEVMRQVLWADADRIGLPARCIRISHRIDVPDGGVDAVVEAHPALSCADALMPGRASYQIKAGTAFRPTRASHIHAALFDVRKGPKHANLKPAIRRCLQEEGTYVLVCFGTDPTETELAKGVRLIQSALADAGFPNARKPKVWGTTQIRGFIRRFPPIVDQLTRRRLYQFTGHAEWSDQRNMQAPLELADEQSAAIDGIRSALLDKTAPHIRVTGEPGVGKTRAVLEATRHDLLSPLVAYYEDPEQLLEDRLLQDIRRRGSGLRAILVIDDCTYSAYSSIWDKLATCTDRVRVVTIAHDDEGAVGDSVVSVPRLPDEEICRILESYVPLGLDGRRWAALCEGSPRFAHLIGQSLATDSGDVLGEPNVRAAVDRIVAGRDRLDSTTARERRTVLRYLAMFQRFGFENPVEEEGESIARLIEQDHPRIGVGAFREAVSELRQRRILQGRRTLYVVPKALQLYLWREWWEHYGSGFDHDRFSSLPGQLYKWFLPLFRYAGSCDQSLAAARGLLGHCGPFQSLEDLDARQNASFFCALTEADSGLALDRLKQTVGKASKEELLTFRTGRAYIKEALQRIAVWREHFVEAARLLARLAIAETEDYSNNTTGIFSQLFTNAYGGLAPTEAPPHERLPLLEEFAFSDDPDYRTLARKACKGGLSIHSGGRIVGPEHQGLRREASLWMPKTYGDWYDAYRRVWRLVEKAVGQSETSERSEWAKVLLGSFTALIQCEWIRDECLETLERLAQAPTLGDLVVGEIVQTLHYHDDRLPSEVADRLRSIHDRVVEQSFRSRLRRYVGMHFWEDESDRGERKEDLKHKIDALATYAVRHRKELQDKLGWLMAEAQNPVPFGEAVSRYDPDQTILPEIIRLQRTLSKDTGASFLSGYLRGILGRDPDEFERLLDECANDPNLESFVIEISWRCGSLSKRSVDRITGVLERGADPIQLRLYRYGRQIKKVTEADLERWIRLLLRRGSLAHCCVALELLHCYYREGKEWLPLPKHLCRDALTQESLFTGTTSDGRKQMMADYYWIELARRCVEQFREDAVPILEKYLRHTGAETVIFDRHDSRSCEAFFGFVGRCPDAAWDTFFRELDQRTEGDSGGLFEVLCGPYDPTGIEMGCWPKVPKQLLWGWIDENTEYRAETVARHLPRALREDGRPTITRDFLARYGHLDDTRSSLFSRFWGGTFCGKMSENHRRRVAKVIEWKEGEESGPVNRWIDDFVASLSADIERAEMEEEREGL